MEINYTINDLDKVVKTLLNSSESKIILFHGSMGVGKTTLIKALVKALGSVDEVQSPTYALVNEYQGNEGSIFHFDLYRMNTIDEAYNIGIEDYLYSDNYCLIEWPEIIESLLPDSFNTVILKENDKQLRKLTLKI